MNVTLLLSHSCHGFFHLWTYLRSANFETSNSLEILLWIRLELHSQPLFSLDSGWRPTFRAPPVTYIEAYSFSRDESFARETFKSIESSLKSTLSDMTGLRIIGLILRKLETRLLIFQLVCDTRRKKTVLSWSRNFSLYLQVPRQLGRWRLGHWRLGARSGWRSPQCPSRPSAPDVSSRLAHFERSKSDRTQVAQGRKFCST